MLQLSFRILKRTFTCICLQFIPSPPRVVEFHLAVFIFDKIMRSQTRRFAILTCSKMSVQRNSRIALIASNLSKETERDCHSQLLLRQCSTTIFSVKIHGNMTHIFAICREATFTHFWVTVCKTVRPMLSVLSVSLSCLRRWCIVAKRLNGLGCHLVWK